MEQPEVRGDYGGHVGLHAIDDLRPHPLNERIYDDGPDEALIASIREHGILDPLLITPDGVVLSGHRRLAAARICGLVRVPAVACDEQDELVQEELLIQANRQRSKTNEQAAREAEALLAIESERARRRQLAAQANDAGEAVRMKSSELLGTPGKAIDHVAKALHIGPQKADRQIQVVRTIDRLAADGKGEEAEALRRTLNRGTVERAYQQARRDGHLGLAPGERAWRYPSFTMPQWSRLTEEERHPHLYGPWPAGARFNFEGDQQGIGWARWSANPITGCTRSCECFCYAKKITEAKHLYEFDFNPTYHPHVLRAFDDTPLPPQAAYDITYKNVFVVSMGDMLGKWIADDIILAVIRAMARNDRFNYMILTKDPERLLAFDWPKHCWLGATVDHQGRVKRTERAFAQLQGMGYTLWLSVEPMWEAIRLNHLEYWRDGLIVLGGASPGPKTPAFYPRHEWIYQLEADADRHGVHVYEKSNLWRPRHGFPGDTGEREPTEAPAELFACGYLRRHAVPEGGEEG
jgi:ParB-like chromosome segregation protein Spo0J/protein gp37